LKKRFVIPAVGVLVLLAVPTCTTDACASGIERATSCADVVTLDGSTYPVRGDCLRPDVVGDPVPLDPEPENEAREAFHLVGIPLDEAIGVSQGPGYCNTLAWKEGISDSRLREIERQTLIGGGRPPETAG
jgi:hypothetical protein